MKKPVITLTSILETAIAFLDVTLHHHKKDIDCPAREREIITDLSTPQITGKPKPNYEVLENNLISLKAKIVSLKEFIMG